MGDKSKECKFNVLEMLKGGQKCFRCGTKGSELESEKAMVKEWDIGGVVVTGNDKV